MPLSPTRRLLAALALTCAAATPALAFDPAAMNDAEKAAFGQAVRDYLMANPEVLVEAFNELESRRVANEAENDKVLLKTFAKDLTDDGYSWVGGNPEGDLTVVEFLDYRCGVCRGVYAEVEDLVKTDGNIRIIYKEFPILGEESDLASRFAIAVKQIAGDDSYKAAHDALMTLKGNVTLDSLGKLAAKLGVEAKPVLARMNSEDVTTVIRQNHQLAEKMRIAGTPTFVIGDALLRGVPQAGLKPVVEDVRARAAAGG